MFMFIDNFDIKNKSYKKQVLRGALSVLLRGDPYSFVVLRYDLRCSKCDRLLCQCSICFQLLRCSGSAGRCFTKCL